MNLFALSVRDSAADSYHAPLCFPSLGVAERWFRDECNSRHPENQIAQHPEDYELQLVGNFETSTGEFVACAPRLVLRGADAMKKPS